MSAHSLYGPGCFTYMSAGKVRRHISEEKRATYIEFRGTCNRSLGPTRDKIKTEFDKTRNPYSENMPP